MTLLAVYLQDPDAVVRLNGKILTLEAAKTTTLLGTTMDRVDMGDKIVKRLNAFTLVTVASVVPSRQARSIAKSCPYWAEMRYAPVNQQSRRYGG